MLRRKASVFAPTDGVARIVTEAPERLARGYDWTGEGGTVTACALPFQAMSMRQQDVELAESQGAQWTRKVRVRACPALEAGELAIVGGRPHEVGYVDVSGRLAYLYLTELVGDGTVDLVAESVTYDGDRQARRTEAVTTVHARRQAPGASRTTAASRDALAATCDVTVRAVDWAGETVVRRGGASMAVQSATASGAWVTLSCRVTSGQVGA